MLSVFPHYKCNLSCSHCVTQHLSSKCNGYMSKDDIDRIIKYSVENEPIIIMGGEPLLYNNLEYLINKSIDNNHLVFLYTNGVFGLDNLDTLKLLKKNNSWVIIKLSPSLASDDGLSKVIETVRALEMESINVRLRATLSVDYNKFDIEYIVDTLKELNPKVPVEVGLNSPGPRYNSSIDEFYNSMKPTFLGFLDKLKKENIEYASTACFQIPVCYFTEDEIAEYQITEMNCNPQVCIQPDLCVSSCYDLNYNRMYFFENRQEFEDLVKERKLDRLEGLSNIKKECKDCNHFKEHKCSIACVSFDKGYSSYLCSHN